LPRIILSDNRLEDLIDDRWENALVVVNSQVTVEALKLRLIGSVKHSQAHIDHLEVLGAGHRLDCLGMSSHVVNDGSLEPGKHQMIPFLVHGVTDSGQLAELDGSVSSID
jgi:hypothetical protein